MGGLRIINEMPFISPQLGNKIKGVSTGDDSSSLPGALMATQKM